MGRKNQIETGFTTWKRGDRLNNKFIKGAIILSLSMFLTKILGIVYLIPFKQLVGDDGISLYSYAYNLYGLFISLSTLGIPIGMAKFVSKYQAQGEYDTAQKMFRYGIIGMIGLGCLGFLIMYLFAPIYVSHILNNDAILMERAEEIITVIRVVSIALTVIPVMAIFRGFFQGNQNMMPTSISQFFEQLVRVCLILIGSYCFIILQGKSYQEAVSFSVFAAFLSGVASLFILLGYWVKEKKVYDQLLHQSVEHPKRKAKDLWIELIQFSLPFAILGLATILFQNIDTLDFHRLLTKASVPLSHQKVYYGIYTMELSKIVMISVSFALAFGQPLVPELTHFYQKRVTIQVQKTIYLALKLTAFITFPAIVGMSQLAKPIYLLFYHSSNPNVNEMGGQLFVLGVGLGLFYAFYSILSSILQGLNLQNKGIIFLLIALGIKYISNQILVPLIGMNGFIYSTMLAYLIWLGLSFYQIKKKTRLSLKRTFKNLLPFIWLTAIMGLFVFLFKNILNIRTDYESSRLMTGVYVALCGGVGVLVYGGLAYYLGIIESLLGKKK